MGSRADVWLLPVDIAGRIPCEAEAQSEPSRRLCSFFRKSRDSPTRPRRIDRAAVSYLPVQRVGHSTWVQR